MVDGEMVSAGAAAWPGWEQGGSRAGAGKEQGRIKAGSGRSRAGAGQSCCAAPGTLRALAAAPVLLCILAR